MNANEAVVEVAAVATQPKKLTDKVASLVSEREKVRAELSARLGKGARVANAAKFAALPKNQQNINAFVRQIMARNQKAKEERNAAKAAGKAPKMPQLPVIVEESVAKTSKAKAKPKGAAAASAAAARRVTKKVKNNSVEREAKKLVKQMEEIDGKLRTVGLDAATACDFQRRMETAGVDGKQVLKLCKSFLD